MIRNILLVTWRNLTRNKVYTTINIVGLALGMAAFLLINAYNNFENSYDRMHAGGEHIYRVESQFYKGEDLTDDWATSTNGYARAMHDNHALCLVLKPTSGSTGTRQSAWYATTISSTGKSMHALWIAISSPFFPIR
jgi:hypothetical protein